MTNYLISYSGSSLPSGTTKVNFDTGKVAYSDGSLHNLKGSLPTIYSLTIYTSVASTLQLKSDTASSTIDLPAGKYTKIKNVDVDRLEVTTSSTYDLWLNASSMEVGAAEVT